MSTQAAGLPTSEGQPQSGNPAPAGQPQAPNTPPPPPALGEQPKQENPQLAELQQKLATLEAEAKKNAESARFYQSNFDKAQQQLRAVVGAQQPQADPVAEDVKYWVGQGYDEKDARAMVDYVNRKTQPLMQQLHAAQQTLQATTQTSHVLQSAMADPGYGMLFADTDVQTQVHQALQQAALSGQPELVNPAYAVEIAKLAYMDKHKPWAVQQPGQPSQPTQHFNFPGLLGPQSTGFRPAPAVQSKPTNPHTENLTAQMAAYTGIPIQQQQS